MGMLRNGGGWIYMDEPYILSPYTRLDLDTSTDDTN